METISKNTPSQITVTESAERERRFVPRSRLSAYLSEVSKEDIPWAVNFLVSQLVIVPETIQPHRNHIWEDYKLSPEIEALSSFERTKLPADYDAVLTEQIEEKYR